ncbi:MAG: hypothetical protein PUC46_08115 [Lachnospiraceae bacterium]|nr:hypothetical protein [Lachnospiraceae bacterium]
MSSARESVRTAARRRSDQIRHSIYTYSLCCCSGGHDRISVTEKNKGLYLEKHFAKEERLVFPLIRENEKADPTLTKDPSDKFFLKDGSHATAFDTEEDYLDAQEDHAEELFHDHLVK